MGRSARRSLLSGLVAVVLLACLHGSAHAADPLRLGAVIQLTGAGANYGNDSKRGIDLAVDQVNARGGISGRKIEIIYEDSKSEPRTSVMAITKLIQVDKVPVVFTTGSPENLAMIPVAESSRTLIVNVIAQSPEIKKQRKDYVFSTVSDASVYEYLMGKFTAEKLGLKEVAVIYVNDDFGLGGKTSFTQGLTESGGKVVQAEAHQPGATDFRAQLTKLKSLGPKAVYISSRTREAAYILKQADQLGVKTQWLSGMFFEGPEIIAVAGASADGVIYDSPAFDVQNGTPEMKKFGEAFQAKYKQPANQNNACGYDGVMLVAEAAAKAGTTADAVKTYLYGVKNWPGTSGLITFQKDGSVLKPVRIKTFKDQKFTLYNVQP